MNAYSIALFLHVVGAWGFFVALGLEWTGLWKIRAAVTAEPARRWMRILGSVRKLGFASMLTAVVTGIYMTVTAWGSPAWISVTVGALVVVIALAAALTGPRMAAIGRALASEEPASRPFRRLANHPLLWISVQTRMAIALGIAVLKNARPDLGGSLLTIAVAMALGVASALPSFATRRHEKDRPGDMQGQVSGAWSAGRGQP
jgi:hypothetical protein